jgi:hypothetical protein
VVEKGGVKIIMIVGETVRFILSLVQPEHGIPDFISFMRA